MPYIPRPPATSDALSSAMQKLVDALEGSRPKAPAQTAPLDDADQMLVEAVRANDIQAVDAAFKNGAQPNAGSAKALQVAAETRNAALMQELVIRGADVAAAVEGLKAEQKTFGVATVNRDDPQVRAALEAMVKAIVPQSRRGGVQASDIDILLNNLDRQLAAKHLLPPGAQKRLAETKAAIQTLEEWNANFTKEIAPVEILRQQRQILEQLAEMKRQMFPARLDKPKLSGPKNNPPQP